MLKSSRRFFGQFFQYRFIDVRQFDKAYSRYESERFFDEIYQGIGEQYKNEIDEEIEKYNRVNLVDIPFLMHDQPDIH